MGRGIPPPREFSVRKFGVELEMVGPRGVNAIETAVQLLSDANIPCRHSQYSGRAYDRWQAKPDGSIQPYDRAAEIVSRIMPAAESSYDELRRAVDVLDAAGFGVNRTCGFHVHLNVSDLPMTTRRLIVLRYASLQAQINDMMPPSRRNNGYCQAVPEETVRALALAIDTNGRVPPIGRGVTNVAWMDDSQGQNARIEFRQAAGTCNADKVIGWVRFLQEMVEEVARRAAGVTFGAAPPPPPPVRPAPVVLQPVATARVPRMRPGSDAYRVLQQLRTHGAVSAPWASEQGIVEPVLRRIIVGFRRHGADIVTTNATQSNPLRYHLAGARTLPLTEEQVFAVTAAAGAPVAPPAPPAPAPVAPPAPTRPASRTFVSYDFNIGLSEVTQRWCRQRLEDIQAATQAAA
jgi:hypothetical protein